jgi:uncharacterized protein YbcI
MDTDGAVAQRSPLAHISREMVRLYKEQFGRGPTKSRAAFAGPDVLICTLEDSMTPAERNLVAMGEDQRMRDTRLFFQYATEPEFVGAVEETFQRKVRGFISGMDVRTDISNEIFHFEPRETSQDDDDAAVSA